VKAGNIEPGEKESVKFTFTAGGKYEMYCPIDGHRQRGMQGSITVGGAAGSGVATTPAPATTTSDDGMTTTGRYQAPGY